VEDEVGRFALKVDCDFHHRIECHSEGVEHEAVKDEADTLEFEVAKKMYEDGEVVAQLKNRLFEKDLVKYVDDEDVAG